MAEPDAGDDPPHIVRADDARAIQAALERRTRAALLQRLGPASPDAQLLLLWPAGPSAVSSASSPERPARPSPHSPRPLPTSRPAGPPADVRGKARGIGFTVDLVRAILAGRKTQTRRLMRPQPADACDADAPAAEACPVARAGEWLFVREPWLKARAGDGVERFEYAVDAPPAGTPTAGTSAGGTSAGGRKFKPAMYMPRDAARLWLRVTGVRAERLRSISPADLAAEGLPPGRSLAAVWDGFYDAPGHRWADDPWVWAIMFEIETGPGPLPGT